jgi:DNA polymerase-1
MKGIPYDEMVFLLEQEENEGKSRTLKNERVVAKTVNFGVLFGATAHRLQKELKYKANMYWSLDKCEDFINRWMSKYTRIAEWLEHTKHFAVKHKAVDMPMGHIRHLDRPSFFTPDGRGELRQATNFPIQSFASWICLLGCYLIDEYFLTSDIPARIVLQVHDSVTCEVKSTDKKYLTNIEKYVKMVFEIETVNVLNKVWGIDFNVPLEFKTSICKRWS